MKLSKFIKNLLSIYSANFIIGITGIASIPLVVSALGNEQYGVYSIYTVLVSYIALVDCGVTKHFVRLIASDRNTDNQTDCLQKALGWYLVLASILIISLPLTIYFVSTFLFPVSSIYKKELYLIIIFVMVEFCISIPTMMSQTLTVSNESFYQISKYNIVTGFYRYGFMISGAFLFKRPSMVVGFMLMRRIIDIYCAKKLLQWPGRDVWHPQINFREFKTILKKSSILSLAQFLQTTIVAIGSFFVNREFGTSVLGNYRAAFDLGGKIWFLSNGVGMLLFPKFSKILAENSERKEISNRIYELLKSSWVAYLLIGLIGILSAKFILPLIRLESEQILLFFIILFLGICINAHSNVAYEFLLADGRYETVAKLSITSLLLLGVSFYSLKSVTGPYAIAWAWVICQSVYAILADELLVAITPYETGLNNKMSILFKISLLSIALICMFTEVYFRSAISITFALIVIISGFIYLFSGLLRNQILKKKL